MYSLKRYTLNPETLAKLTLFIAESNPKNKDKMIRLILQLLRQLELSKKIRQELLNRTDLNPTATRLLASTIKLTIPREKNRAQYD